MSIERGFYRGREVVNQPEVENEEMRDAAAALFQLFSETTLAVQQSESERTRKIPWVVFDLDGVIVEAGIDTAANPQTFTTYLNEHKGEFIMAQQLIEELRAKGVRFMINTGRGLPFAQIIADELFGAVGPNAIVAENGSIISEKGALRDPKSANAESLDVLREIKLGVEKHYASLGWGVENKTMMISLNPPKGMPAKIAAQLVNHYFNSIGVAHKVLVKYSATAVDIIPIGADKREALEQVMGDNGAAVYFGDSAGDHTGMSTSVVAFTPKNAENETKDFVQHVTANTDTKMTLSFHLDKPVLSGVNDALQQMNAVIDFLQTQKIEREPISTEDLPDFASFNFHKQIQWGGDSVAKPGKEKRSQKNGHLVVDGVAYPFQVERFHMRKSPDPVFSKKDWEVHDSYTYILGDEHESIRGTVAYEHPFDPSGDLNIRTSIIRKRPKGQERIFPEGLGIQFYEKMLDEIQASVNDAGRVGVHRVSRYTKFATHHGGEAMRNEKWDELFTPVLIAKGYTRVSDDIWQNFYIPEPKEESSE